MRSTITINGLDITILQESPTVHYNLQIGRFCNRGLFITYFYFILITLNVNVSGVKWDWHAIKMGDITLLNISISFEIPGNEARNSFIYKKEQVFTCMGLSTLLSHSSSNS